MLLSDKNRNSLVSFVSNSDGTVESVAPFPLFFVCRTPGLATN